MPEVSDFLDQVISQDFASAAPTFKDIMGDLVQDSLEQEKVKMSNQVFNGVDPEEREAEDQYELDLDDPDMDDEEELDAAAEEALDAEDDDYEDGEMEEEDEFEPEEDSEEEQ